MELIRYATIGQYIPRESMVHRLDPRTKIAAMTFLMVAIFLVPDFAGYTLMTVFVLGTLVLAQIPLRFLAQGLRPVFFLLAFTVVLNLFFSGIQGGTELFRLGPLVLTRESLSRALFIGYRLVALVVVTSLMTFTTSPVALTDGLERLLRPFRRVGLPAHELAMMMTIALRFIPTLLEETEKIMKAQMARGADFRRGNVFQRARALVPILVPLFVSAFRRADDLALAMEARCYRGGEGRTRMKELRFARADTVALLIVLAAGILCVLPAEVWARLVR